MSGQVAVVTGGGAGIGRACARRLAESGADIILADIDPARCAAMRTEIEVIGRRGIALELDMMDVAAVQTLLSTAQEAFGRVDILINNVGGVRGRAFAEQSERNWRRHIDINFVSMLAATSAAIPLIVAGGQGGAIVNVASSEGERAAPGYAVYAACKAAMINFTKTMALELGEHGIRVNAIAPDHTITPGNRPPADTPVEVGSGLQEAMGRLIPLGREGLAEECGDVVAFLCSPLSSYITGATIPVDGGTAAAAGWRRGLAGGWIQIER